MDMKKFIDLCILCGCDYTTNIPHVGPVKAFNYIRETNGTIEAIIQKLKEENANPKRKQKVSVPKTFLNEEGGELFNKPDIAPVSSLKIAWKAVEEEALKKFLVEDKGFTDGKVDSAIRRLKACKTKAN